VDAAIAARRADDGGAAAGVGAGVSGGLDRVAALDDEGLLLRLPALRDHLDVLSPGR
jgi:hypothetical protein